MKQVVFVLNSSESSAGSKTMKERKELILNTFKKADVTTISLVGKPGTGKTYFAREIIRDCANTSGLSSGILWIFMNKKYDRRSLFETIAQQLSLFFIAEEWVDDDEDDEKEGKEEDLKQMISVELEEGRSMRGEEDKRLILVLDDVCNWMNEKEIVSELKALLPQNQQHLIKVIITRSENGETNEVIENCDGGLHKFETLSLEDSINIFKERVGVNISGFPGFEQLSTAIVEKGQHLPSAIVAYADALNYIGKNESGLWIMECALEESASEEEAADKATPLMRLLHSWYDMLPNSVMVNCCWHSRRLLCKHGGVHYNELIAHWIMEGYFGHIDQIEKAYEEGHNVLMNLIDYGVLKEQEDSIVRLDGATVDMTDHRPRGFGGTSSLGLASVFEDGEWEGLGILTQTDGMIKSLCSPKKWEEVSTLLIDRNRLCKEVPERFFKRMKRLQVLVLFNSKFKSLPISLSDINNLLVLVLRDCEVLDNIDHIRNFRNLSVLEISGDSSLEILPDNLFDQMPNLRSLNLSSLPIKKLPLSLSNRKELRLLILRECCYLETLSTLKEFEKLEVLDLSGATSLNKFQDRNFRTLGKLQTLDLSGTSVLVLPYFGTHEDFTRLLLSGCKKLTRLPNMKTLTRLQILDLSDAIMLKEIPNDAVLNSLQILHLSGAKLLEKIPMDLACLKVLDLSKTKVSVFPSNITNLSSLCLKDCSELKRLPSTREFKYLELLNLSDSSRLVEIEDNSFEHLRYLLCLNLSKTSVKSLPSISNLGNLRKILLNNCSALEKLPEMRGLDRLELLDLSGASSLQEVGSEHLNHRNLRKLLLSGCKLLTKLPLLTTLEKLEELDLSGCVCLEKICNDSFEHMSQLQQLNLSGTQIEYLPSLSNLSNLSHLLLGDCVKLKKLSSLESLSKLEELDLCGASKLEETTAQFLQNMIHLRILRLSGPLLVALPPMSQLTKLSHLSLQGCALLGAVPNLEALTTLEVLDLSGTAIRGLPSLDTFTNLRQLLLRDCSSLTGLSLLNSVSCLEHLDLWGTGIRMFPYEILELACLKHLDLPDLTTIPIDWGKIWCLPEELNWGQCGIFKSAEPIMDSERPSILVSGTKFFEFLEETGLWATLKSFHFSVRSFKSDEDGDICCDRYEHMFRYLYCKSRHISYSELQYQSLEILGSNTLPEDFNNVLGHAKYLSLIDNSSITCLSELDAEHVRGKKGFWLERCLNMQSILGENDIDVELGKNMEILWVANLPNLRALYSGNVLSGGFTNLKRVYLDCCRTLVNVFSSSQLPQGLEILHIKFCDNLKTIFEHDGTSKFRLPNLLTLLLVELPELKTIGAELPPSTIPIVKQCPKLEK